MPALSVIAAVKAKPRERALRAIYCAFAPRPVSVTASAWERRKRAFAASCAALAAHPKVCLLTAKAYALRQHGAEVWAVNESTGETRCLGFVPVETPHLTANLPSGTYRIFTKSCGDLVDGARGRESWAITVTHGQPSETLPTSIVGLSGTITDNYQRQVSWLSESADMAGTRFGVWLTATGTDADLSAEPDYTVMGASGTTAYACTFTQTAPCRVTVAAWLALGGQKGPASYVELPWEAASPAPDNQTALTMADSAG